MDYDKKRSRSHNWEELEKNNLIESIREELNIVENKKKTTILNKDKIAAWERVARNMEAGGTNMNHGFVSTRNILSYSRDLRRIKEQWQRMKVIAKKNISQYRKQCSATGGGPPPVEPSDLDWKIKSILPDEFVEDLSVHDSDAINDTIPYSCSTPTTSQIFEHFHSNRKSNFYPTDTEPSQQTNSDLCPAFSETKRKYDNVRPCQSFTTSCTTPFSSIQEGDVPSPSIKRSCYLNNSESSSSQTSLPKEMTAALELSEDKKTSEDVEETIHIIINGDDDKDEKKKKQSKKMSLYEEKLYDLNRARMDQLMAQSAEMHTLKLANEREYHAERMRLLREGNDQLL